VIFLAVILVDDAGEAAVADRPDSQAQT